MLCADGVTVEKLSKINSSNALTIFMNMALRLPRRINVSSAQSATGRAYTLSHLPVSTHRIKLKSRMTNTSMMLLPSYNTDRSSKKK